MSVFVGNKRGKLYLSAFPSVWFSHENRHLRGKYLQTFLLLKFFKEHMLWLDREQRVDQFHL